MKTEHFIMNSYFVMHVHVNDDAKIKATCML